MPQILAFSSSFVTLKFSVSNPFKTRVLLKIFDAEFPFKYSNILGYLALCLPAKMAAEIVIRSTVTASVTSKSLTLRSTSTNSLMTTMIHGPMCHRAKF